MPYNRDLSRYQANCNVYVRNIGDATVRELEALFSTCGNIISSKVMYDTEEQSLGYGYILFATEQAAQRAIETRQGFNYKGNTLEVERFRPRGDRASDESDFKGIYIKQVIDADDIPKLFSEYGDIENVYHSETFTIVTFMETAAAKAAIEGYADHPTLVVSRAMTKTQLRTEAADRYSTRVEQWKATNLIVKNLDESVTSEHLKDIFTRCGNVASAKVAMIENKFFKEGVLNSEIKSRGYGFVCYESAEEAKKAILTMNDATVCDKKLQVLPWVPKTELSKRYAKSNMRKIMSRMTNAVKPNVPFQMRRPETKPIPNRRVTMSEGEQKRQLGEAIYTFIQNLFPTYAGKITGMLLEMPINELSELVEDKEKLRVTAEEALGILESHMKKTSVN